MPLDHAWIEQHIPHKGRMCLLDEVLSWDAAHIRCRSASHTSASNPLRLHGRLGAACGIEYAAQAMAVHGALIAASAPLASTVAMSAMSRCEKPRRSASDTMVALCIQRCLRTAPPPASPPPEGGSRVPLPGAGPDDLARSA